MSSKFEEQLREALRPVEPGEGFAERVMARVADERRTGSRSGWRGRFARPALALAASLIVGAMVIYTWQMQRERQGLQARQQLIEALRVTGEKLDLAYRGVNGEPRPPAPDDVGA
jgi:hypothetical protein